MPDESTSWEVELVNELTGPANEIKQSIDAITGGADRADAQVKKLNETLKTVAGQSRQLKVDKKGIEDLFGIDLESGDFGAPKAAGAAGGHAGVLEAYRTMAKGGPSDASYLMRGGGGASGGGSHSPGKEDVENWKQVRGIVDHVAAQVGLGDLVKAGVAVGALNMAFDATLNIVGAVIGNLIEVGEELLADAIHAHDWGVQMGAAFDIAERATGRGVEAFQEMKEAAKDLGIAPEILEKTYLHLRNVGFQVESIRGIISGGMALGDIMGDPKGGLKTIEQFIDKLERQRDKGGKLSTGALMGLEHLGIAPEAIEAQLGKMFGTTTDVAKQKLHQGIVSEGDVIQAALQAINSKVERTGVLGATQADITANTVGGGLNALKVSLDELLEGVNVQPVIDFLRDVRGMLETPAASHALQDILSSVFNILTDMTKVGPNGKSGIQDFFETAISFGKTLASVLGEVVKAIKSIHDYFSTNPTAEDYAGSDADLMSVAKGFGSKHAAMQRSGQEGDVTLQQLKDQFELSVRRGGYDEQIKDLSNSKVDAFTNATIIPHSDDIARQREYFLEFQKNMFEQTLKESGVKFAPNAPAQDSSSPWWSVLNDKAKGQLQQSIHVEVGGVTVKTEGDAKKIGEGVGQAINESVNRGAGAAAARDAAAQSGAM